MAESREMTVGRFVTAANEVTIGGFWREHAKDELRTRKNHEVLRFLSPCWEKKYMAKEFYAKDTIFEVFVQELLNVEYAHKPLAGPVFGLSQIPVQHGSSIHVQQRSGDTSN